MRRLLPSLIAMIAIVVAACSGGGATSAPIDRGHDRPVGRSTRGPLGVCARVATSSAPLGIRRRPVPRSSGSLTVWHSYGSGAGTELAAFTQNLDRIKAANPGLNVTVTEVPFDQLFNKINTSWGAGETTPDMFIAPNDSLGFQAREGLLADLSAYEGRLTTIAVTAVEGSKVEGKLYEIPESLKNVAIYYNKDTVPTPPKTTDELLAMIAADKKVALFEGTNGLYHNFGWWAAFGGELMDASGKCIADAGGVADAMKFLVDLKAAGATLTPDYDIMANGFKDGTYDLIIDGPWALGGYRDAVANLGVAEMPAGPSGPSKPLLGVDGFYINASSPNVDLAAEFALAMTSAESQRVWTDVGGHVPADTTVTGRRRARGGIRCHGAQHVPATAGQGTRQLLEQLRRRAGEDHGDGRRARRHRGGCLRGDEHRQRQVAITHGEAASGSSDPGRPRRIQSRQDARPGDTIATRPSRSTAARPRRSRPDAVQS